MDVSMDEIDDFVKRAEEVERQVKALVSNNAPTSAAHSTDEGQLVPRAVAGPLPLSAEEDLARQQQQSALDRQNSKRWAAEMAAREAVEERERWWKLAFYSKNRFLPDEDDLDGTAASGIADRRLPSGEADAKARFVRYTGPDYSRWNAWVKQPDDPVSREEMKVRGVTWCSAVIAVKCARAVGHPSNHPPGNSLAGRRGGARKGAERCI